MRENALSDHPAAVVNRFKSSNSTTKHFLGVGQRGWMTHVGGNNTSLLQSSPGHPVATGPTGVSAPAIRLQDAIVTPAIQPPATQPQPQPPSGMQAARTGHTQASNVRRAMVAAPQPTSARKRSSEVAFILPAPPVKRPLEQHQQQPPRPPTTVATSPSSSDSHGITTETLPRLNAFLDMTRSRGHLTDLVSFRAAILTDALIYNDTFYLFVHQIFCRATADAFFTTQIGFGDEQLRGFEMMQAILFSNGDLPHDALQFFANFPYSEPTRHSGQFVSQARSLLYGLGVEGLDLIRTCIRRGYPPFADESRTRLHLESPIFQKVFYNSIHRQLTQTNSPVWAEEGIRLFDENQRNSQERLAVIDYPLSDQQLKAEALQLGTQYLILRSRLQYVRADISPMSSGPPVDADNQVIQHSSATVPGTATFSHHTLRGHNEGMQVQLTDAALPPHMQEHFSQSPRVDHILQQQQQQQQPPPPPPPPQTQHQYPVTGQQHGGSRNATNIGNHVQQTQHQYPVVDQQQHSSLHAANSGNLVQQSQLIRGGQPALSHSRQNSLPMALPTLPISPVTANNPIMENTSRVGRPGTAAAPRTVPSLTRGPPKPDKPYPPFFPPLAQKPIQWVSQNYKIVALHQAYLRSPKYRVSDVQGTMNHTQRLYQVPTSYVLSPQVLGHSCPFFSWRFRISADDMQTKAKDVLFLQDPRNVSSAVPVREVTSGSSLYRLKCVEVPACTTSTSTPEDVLATCETVWPTGIFFAINEEQLEVRRKLHHGKDLTIDLTSYVKEGLNTVTCSLLRTMEATKLSKNFAVVVEVVQIISDDRITSLPILLKEADAKDIITKSLKRGLHAKCGGTDNNGTKDQDDEIQILDADVSIDITDPHTAGIFEMPVRGKTCLHRECFDLQTFLDTRKACTRDQDRGPAPTSPDEWKCPMCKRDARPQNLVVDGFLQQVRKELGERNQLDAKAIRVQADGSWQAVLDTQKVDRRGSAHIDGISGGGASWR